MISPKIFCNLLEKFPVSLIQNLAGSRFWFISGSLAEKGWDDKVRVIEFVALTMI